MKTIIKEDILCCYDNIKKYLPPQYVPLTDKKFYGKTVTLVFFPVKETVTSSYVVKVYKKIKNPDAVILFFARCFTIEALNFINENNGTAFALVEFPWTDDRYNKIRGG